MKSFSSPSPSSQILVGAITHNHSPPPDAMSALVHGEMLSQLIQTLREEAQVEYPRGCIIGALAISSWRPIGKKAVSQMVMAFHSLLPF